MHRASFWGGIGSGALVLLSAWHGFAAGPPATADGKAQSVTPQQAAFFESKIRPLLADRCFECHSDKQQKGGLRLDTRADILKGNASGPALVPGDPEKSRLIQVIHYDGKVKMPPPGKLRSDEIAALTEWIKMGAPWPDSGARGQEPGARETQHPTPNTQHPSAFWSFRPVKKPALPKVKNTAWVKSPIDAFVLAKLEAKGLQPAPPADRRSLIRRAYFDLIGLPPAPEEVAAFVADKSPNAFAKVVDHLLASPQYGERWGRHWLDVARYADSNGLDENLAFGNAYRYRDYVVAAFNKDKPYNQFVLEQLAGDLMPTDDTEIRNERITATGFLCLGAKVLAEQDKPKLVMDIVDEQIEVTSKAFLGLTVACARCHNHKFDPIPTQDYYALAGIFKSTRTMADLGFVSRVYERPLASKDLQAQAAAHNQKVQTLQAALQTVTDRANAELQAMLRKDAAQYLAAGWELAQQPGLRSIAETPARPGDPPRLIVEAEKFDRGNVNRDFVTYGQGIGIIHNLTAPDNVEWDITLPQAGTYQIELRYAAAESRPVHLLLNGKLLRADAAGQVTGSWQPDGQRWEPEGIFAFRAGKNTLQIQCDGAIPHFDKILIAAMPSAQAAPNAPAPRTAEQIAAQYGLNAELVKRFADRIRAARFPDEEAARKALLSLDALNDPKGLFAVPEKPERFYSEAAKAQVKQANDALKAEQAKAPQAPMTLAVEDDKTIANCRVHIRGNTLTLGEEVPRRFLTVISGDKQQPIDGKRSGRLELAQWLTRPDHPLTGRVLVNRVWMHHFGQGLVRTPDNWGLLGEPPTHPELLDWLACHFVEGGNWVVGSSGNWEKRSQPAASSQLPNHPTTQLPNPYACGWSLKKLHRLMMLSNTYQMSVVNNPKAQTVDPDNRLLWSRNRRRLEAEPFRDAILAVSGKLDLTLGGTLLTTPDNGYVTNDQSGNEARYNNNRRSLYLPLIRNALFDMFQAFDVGDPSTVNAKRATTTIAPQALWVMNSPFALEQAKHFAEELLLRALSSDTERLQRAYLMAFSRPPTPAETTRALAYLTRYAAQITATEPDVKKRQLAAWQSLCQILFASNEFIYLN